MSEYNLLLLDDKTERPRRKQKSKIAVAESDNDSSTVQDMMLRSVEKRFGSRLPDKPVQRLTDNGSAYTAHDTRQSYSITAPRRPTRRAPNGSIALLTLNWQNQSTIQVGIPAG